MMMHAKIHKDVMGVENLLPFDWLNINEYLGDTHEYLFQCA